MVQIPARAEIWFMISASSAPLANSAMRSTLTARGQWEDKTRERTDHHFRMPRPRKWSR